MPGELADRERERIRSYLDAETSRVEDTTTT